MFRSIILSALLISFFGMSKAGAATSYTYVNEPGRLNVGVNVNPNTIIYDEKTGEPKGPGMRVSAGISTSVGTIQFQESGYTADMDRPGYGWLTMYMSTIDILPTNEYYFGFEFIHDDAPLYVRKTLSEQVYEESGDASHPAKMWAWGHHSIEMLNATINGFGYGNYTSSYSNYDGHTYGQLVMQFPIKHLGPDAAQASLALAEAMPVAVPEPTGLAIFASGSLLGLKRMRLRRVR